MKKRLVALALVFCLALTAFVGIASAEDAAWPAHDMEFIISGSSGSGNDLNMRTMIQYLEPLMGVSIVPINVTGGMVIGQTQMLQAPADGYTLNNTQTPTLFNYYNPDSKNVRKAEDFYVLCNLVSDAALLAVRADDARFADVNNLKDLVEWLKANPSEMLLVTAGAVGGDDQVTSLLLQKAAPEIAEQIIPVNGSGVSESKASFLGGHCDVYAGNVGDVTSWVDSGEVKILAVMDTERSIFLPDVPTATELGFPITNYSCRQIVMHPDTDPAILEKMTGYIEQVVNDPAFIAEMTANWYNIDYRNHDDAVAFIAEQDAVYASVIDLLGWTK